MVIRRPRTYPRDLVSGTHQKNLNRYLRLGVIDNVYPAEGKCTIYWLDGPGIRTDVLLTQANSGEWHVPTKGDVAVVGFGVKEQPRILRYVNVGQKFRSDDSSLPKLREGEKLWETGGSYIHMQSNGNVTVSSLEQGYIILESTTGSFKTDTINASKSTEAGKEYFGLVKRPVINSDGTYSQKLITNLLDENLTEYRLRILETADNKLGTIGLNSPLFDLTVGTVVNDAGKVVDKNDGILNPITYPKKEIAVRIKLKSGVQLDIDKDGRLSVKNVKMNINEGSVDSSDTDIALGLEINDAKLGTKGQHVAREHDNVKIPISTTYTDAEHVGQTANNTANLTALTTLGTMIISPVGPCFLNIAGLGITTVLTGEIVSGAKDVYVGG